MKKTKRVVSFFLVFCLIMTAMPEIKASATETVFSGGSGTESDPYVLAGASDFIQLSNKVAGGEEYDGKYFTISDQVTEPIALSTEDGFSPIGKKGHVFYGSLDGNGKTIDLNLNLPEQSDVGLFGYCSGRYIKNLTVTGSVKGCSFVGGIAGQARMNIMNCHNKATVSATKECVGGIVGFFNNDGVINCTNSGQVEGPSQVGGIVGNLVNAYVTNCLNNGDVTGKGNTSDGTHVGGIVGRGVSGSIKNCVNNAAVKQEAESGYPVGGIAGSKDVDDSRMLTVTGCFYNVTKNSDVQDFGHNINDYTEAISGTACAKETTELESAETLETLNSYAKNNKEGEIGLFSWKLEDHVFSLIPRTYEITNTSAYLTVKESAMQGERVEISRQNVPSYMSISKITFNKKEITPDGKGKYVFEMPAENVTVAATLVPNLQKKDGKYLISDAEDLVTFSQAVNGGFCRDASASLEADIDVSTADGFLPIGIGVNPFSGDFYGNGHTLTLDITDGVDYDTTKATGLFGVIHGASIKDIILKGTVDGGDVADSYTGAVVGVAGLDGADSNYNYVYNVYSEVTVRGGGYVGGIVGYEKNKAYLSNIINNGEVLQSSTAEDKKAVGAIHGIGIHRTYKNVYFNTEKNAGIYDSAYNSLSGLNTSNSGSVIATNAAGIFSKDVESKMNQYVAEHPGRMDTCWEISVEEQTVKLVINNAVYYDINTSAGWIQVPASSREGKTITVAIAWPEEEAAAAEMKSMISGIKVEDEAGNAIDVVDGGEDTYQFVMPPKNVIIYPVFDIEMDTTVEGEYTYLVVKSADDFLKVMKSIAYGNSDVNVKLAKDITLSEAQSSAYPVMEAPTYYMGIFDGDGHTVTAKGIMTPLFGYIGPNGIVNDLTVDGTIGTAESQYSAGIAICNLGYIVNCMNKATILGKMKAGIAAINVHMILSCVNKGTLDNNSAAIVYMNAGVAANVANENKATGGLCAQPGGAVQGVDLSAQTDPQMWKVTAAEANSFIEQQLKLYRQKQQWPKEMDRLFASNVDFKEYAVLETGTGEEKKAELIFADDEHLPYYFVQMGEDRTPYQPGSLVEVTLPETAVDEGYEICGAEVKGLVFSDRFEASPVEGQANTYSFTMPRMSCTVEHVVAAKGLERDENGYFLVKSLDDLKKVKNTIEKGNDDLNVKLMADIDGYQEGPIRVSPGYEGTFDGNHHSITVDLKDSTERERYGLFDIVEDNGVVKDLTIQGKMEVNASYAGAIAGQNHGTVTDCVNNAEIVNKKNGGASGGIVGVAYRSAEIRNCENTGSITSYSAAGIVCRFDYDTFITSSSLSNCTNWGLIKGVEHSAGIVAGGKNVVIENCMNLGMIQSVVMAAGIGLRDQGDYKIVNCFNGGEVIGRNAYGISANVSSIGSDKVSIENTYYLQTESVNAGIDLTDEIETAVSSMAVSADEVETGKVAYLLRQGQKKTETVLWGQKLTGDQVDEHPVLGGPEVYENKVYSGCEKNPGTPKCNYSNEEKETVYSSHNYAESSDGTCHECSLCHNIEQHSDVAKYTVNETEHSISASCDVCGNLGTITLSAPTGDLSYTGTAKEATICGSIKGIETPEIIYSTGDKKAPVNAGNYTASISLTDAEGTKTVSVKISITRQVCNHGGETEVRGVKEASCTEKGYTGDTYCNACGTKLAEGKEVKALGHTYVNGVCSVCNEVWEGTINGIIYQVITEEVDGKLVGKVVTVSGKEQVAVRVAGTGEDFHDNLSDGKVTIPTQISGSDSGQTFVVTEISKNAFSGAEVTEIVVPDTVSGVGTGAFGEAETVTFKGTEPPAGIKDALSTNSTVNVPEGSKDSYQVASGEEANIVEQHVTHIKDNGTRVEPTCEEKGSITYKCEKCGEVIEVVELDAKGHTWDEGKVTKQATETAEGEKNYTCKVCGKTKTEVIPKLQASQEDNEPAEQEPEKQNPPKVETYKNGDTVNDDKANAKYIMVSTSKKESAYRGPIAKNAKTVSVPSTVKIKGVTYKVTGIADNAFRGNKKVTKVTLSSNIKTIGKLAFYGCKKLKTIIIKSKKLTSKTVSKKAFKGLTKATTIKVPKKKLKAYKKLFKSKGLSSKVKIKKY